MLFQIDLQEFREKSIDLADVSKGLVKRDIYPKCDTPKSKLATLLDKRILWEKVNLYMKQKAVSVLYLWWHITKCQ